MQGVPAIASSLDITGHPNYGPAAAATAQVVQLVKQGGLPKGVFRLEVIERQDQGQPGPQFQNVRGVVVGRVLNVLQVRTDRGVIPVVVRPLTSVRFGDSGLAPDDIRAGESVIGYEIALSGNPEGPNSRRVIASIIVVIGKAPERPGGQ